MNEQISEIVDNDEDIDHADVDIDGTDDVFCYYTLLLLYEPTKTTLRYQGTYCFKSYLSD